MTRLAGSFGTGIAVLLASSPVFAQSERDAIRAHVKDGQHVSITDNQGNEINGRIRAITDDGLRVIEHGTSADVRYDQIVRIDRPHDGLANGALIGLGSGAALALVAIAVDDLHDCAPAQICYSEPTASSYVAGALVIGGLGTAVGVAIDALIHHKREIYRRGGQARATISPSFRDSSVGAVVLVSW